MKTLDQLDAKLNQIGAQQSTAETKLEKRTPISSLPFMVTSSGSYYLTGNLTGTAGQAGIAITADHVTIDLNGFALIAPGTTAIAG